MILVTLDSNVWLSGLLWRGEASKVIALAELREIVVFTSKDILMEIFRVLQEEEKFQMVLDEKEMYPVNVIEKIEKTSKLVKITKRLNVIKTDPDDVAYFALVIKLNCPIWTNDKQLKNQNKVKIINTEEIVKLTANIT